MISKLTQRYVEEIEAYSTRFVLFNKYTIYWETYWNEEVIEHTISIYKNHTHQLSISGSKEFVKHRILKWIDDSTRI